MYQGVNGGGVGAPNTMWIGNMFEGNEISCADPNANLNMGQQFGFDMWVHITYIPVGGTGTIICK